MIGERFGRLVINDYIPDRYPKVICTCDCGNIKTLHWSNVKNGKTQSCGCLYKESRGHNGFAIKKHGESHKTVEYQTWKGMKQRCSNSNNSHYKNYGGRGIIVCERWLNSFDNFLEDMGRKPTPQHSIDRIDVNGNYEPSNCRWATPYEQRMNQRCMMK